MDREHLKKWLDYQKQGIKPSRYRLESIVYSNNGISEKAYFNLNDYELFLYPLPENFKKSPNNIEGLMPAFSCKVISNYETHKGGNNFDIYLCLDKVLPLLGFKYRLPIGFSQWEEYEDEWIESLGVGSTFSSLGIHNKLPNDNILEIVNSYEILEKRNDKQAAKAVKIRTRLKEAIELETISKRYSFLSYYSILELISDDLASKRNCPSNNKIAQEISKFSLSTKGSQRTKIYFLLNALENNFNLEKCISLSDIRNNIAHGEQKIDINAFELCKKLAFWASEKFVIETVKIT